jgi:hypothetical protein
VVGCHAPHGPSDHSTHEDRDLGRGEKKGVERTTSTGAYDDGNVVAATYGSVVAAGTAAEGVGSRDANEVYRPLVCRRHYNNDKGGYNLCWEVSTRAANASLTSASTTKLNARGSCMPFIMHLVDLYATCHISL